MQSRHSRIYTNTPSYRDRINAHIQKTKQDSYSTDFLFHIAIINVNQQQIIINMLTCHLSLTLSVFHNDVMHPIIFAKIEIKTNK